MGALSLHRLRRLQFYSGHFLHCTTTTQNASHRLSGLATAKFAAPIDPTRPVQRWLIVVPIVMVVTIVAGTNYSGLADKGAGFTLLFLLSSLAVGFGEEAMFRASASPRSESTGSVKAALPSGRP